MMYGGTGGRMDRLNGHIWTAEGQGVAGVRLKGLGLLAAIPVSATVP